MTLNIRIFLGLMLALLFVTNWYLYPPDKVHGQLVPCPDITSGCAGDGWQIRFDRRPQTIKPFGIIAQLPDVKEAYVRFAMNGMEMGLNRYRLLPRVDGVWTAEVILPICVRGRGDWLMQLELTSAKGKVYYQLPFAAS